MKNADAQYYNLGQDPSSLKWRQIRTDHFRLVYPGDFEAKSQQLINMLEFSYSHGTRTLDYKPSRIPVIVHNRDITPNAFTMWAPRRVELYACPPQNIYAQDWLEQLALHEYRHVVQMDMTNRGFMKGLGLVFGQQAAAALTGIFIPMWFMEGDAVCTETALSHSGRGRIPSFEMEIRAQVLQKGLYSYNKAVFGSYKDYVPDHYVLGYPIVAYTRAKYGYKSWIQTIDRVARKPFSLTPFNRGLKMATGKNKSGLYRETFQYLDSLWRIQASREAYSAYRIISKEPANGIIRFKYPHFINDSLIVAERSGSDDISRFVSVNINGEETVVCTPGYFSSDLFSVYIGTGAFRDGSNKPGAFTADNISIGHGLIAWTERKTDPRWQNRTYSVVRILDLRSGKMKYLTKQSRYFAPAITPDGSSMAVVKVTSDNISSIVLLDIHTGEEKGTLISSSTDLFLNPCWSPDGSKLVFLVLDRNGKSVRMLDKASGTVTCLVPATATEIAFPVFADKFVLFNGSFSGIENIYAVDTVTSEIFRVTSAPFGSCNADYSAGLNKITFSEYSSTGYRIAVADFDPSTWQPIREIQDHSASLYKSLLKDEPVVMDASSLSDSVYRSEPYRKIAHLLTFHSWAPLFINYSDGETSAGISALSQNELGTAEAYAGYKWDYAGKAGMYQAGFSWLGWYPVIDIDAGVGTKAVYVPANHGNRIRYSWNDQYIRGGIRIPLLFSHGYIHTGLQLSFLATLEFLRNNNAPDSAGIYRNGSVHSFDYRLYLYNYHKQGVRDVYPRWGQTLEVNFRHSLPGANDLGNLSSLAATCFLPGFLPHHGVRLYSALQFKHKAVFDYSDKIQYPRGYPFIVNQRIISLRTNYKFPFLYPDCSLGSLLYVKRLKASLFYDHAFLKNAGTMYSMNSLGTEFTADLHFIRFLFPFDLGIRAGYLPSDHSWFTDFLFSINLSI